MTEQQEAAAMDEVLTAIVWFLSKQGRMSKFTFSASPEELADDLQMLLAGRSKSKPSA